MYTTWKVEFYKLQPDSTHSTTAIELDKARDITFRTNIGDGKDSFSFKMPNFGGEYDNYFNIGDRVSIYRKLDSSTIASSDILVNGSITDIPIDENNTNTQVVIKGNNYTETLMQALAFVSPADGATLTIPEYFQQALNTVNLNNKNFQVTWDTVNNPTVKTDGSAFPIITEQWNYKSVLMLFEKYSSKKYTEDVNYYFYVNTENKLVWQPRTQTPSDTYVSNSGLHKELKVRRDKKGVITFVIAKGQSTPSGIPVSTFVQDSAAMGKHGFKPKLMISSANYIKETLVATDRAQDTSKFDEGDFVPNTYPFTTAWISRVASSDPTMVIGNKVTVSDEKDYNRVLRKEAQVELKKEGQSIIDLNKNGKLKVQLDFSPGVKEWGLGDVITVTIPEAGKNNQQMRISEVSYDHSSDSFVLEEDNGSV